MLRADRLPLDFQRQTKSRIVQQIERRAQALGALRAPVASGPVDKLEAMAARMLAQGIETQRVKVHVAGHSRLLDGILPRFRAYLQGIQLHEPKLRIVSNHTGSWLDAASARTPRSDTCMR